MLLTFKTKLEKLASGDKYTTIRIETPSRAAHWERHKNGANEFWFSHEEKTRLENTWDEECHIWWLNPRNMNKFCRKIRTSRLNYIDRKQGAYLDEKDAHADGFSSRGDLIDKLCELHDMTLDEVLNATWYIYNWSTTGGDVREGWLLNHYVVSYECDEFCPLCDLEKKR